MSEDAFGGYLQQDEQGIYSVVRLPADGDPMIARVERIREQEHLFVDTVDEQYVEIYEEMAPTYSLWREYSGEQARYKEDYEARAQTKTQPGTPCSFLKVSASLGHVTGDFAWIRQKNSVILICSPD